MITLHVVIGKEQLSATIALATEGPCRIRLLRAGGRETSYRFHKKITEARAKAIRARIAKFPPSAFR